MQKSDCVQKKTANYLQPCRAEFCRKITGVMLRIGKAFSKRSSHDHSFVLNALELLRLTRVGRVKVGSKLSTKLLICSCFHAEMSDSSTFQSSSSSAVNFPAHRRLYFGSYSSRTKCLTQFVCFREGKRDSGMKADHILFFHRAKLCFLFFIGRSIEQDGEPVFNNS